MAIKSYSDQDTHQTGVQPVMVFDILKLNTGVLQVTFTHLSVGGLLNSTLHETHFDHATGRYHVRVKLPKVTCKGLYNIEGKILGLPVKGKGKCTIIFVNGDYTFSYDANLHPNNFNNNAKKTDSKFVFHLEDVQFNFEDLTNGDAVSNAEINKFLNKNWADVIYDMKDELTYTVKMIVEGLIKVPNIQPYVMLQNVL